MYDVVPSDTNILVVDDTPANLRVLVDGLKKVGYKVRPVSNGPLALSAAREYPPDLILLDIRMPGMDGFDVCRQFQATESTRNVPIIFLTALNESVDKVRAFESGGVDYVTKPFDLNEVLARVHTHLALRNAMAALETQRREKEQLNEQLLAYIAQRNAAESDRARWQEVHAHLEEEVRGSAAMVGGDGALARIREQIELVAPTDATVLILGETGTGKGMVARSIHARSARARQPFIKVNCAALPGGLIESELFGHEKGAFTGATEKRTGRFELADGGTLFLDEIGELCEDSQAKLLRVLQDREFERVGGTKTLRVDVRVCAATNRDLAGRVGEGKFREDLFYRLNVFPIAVPPLRDRLEDIPMLAEHFIGLHAKRLGRPETTHLSADTLARLQAYAWPGNIRELESVIERGLILARDGVVEVGPESLTSSTPNGSPADDSTCLQDVERAHIVRVLGRTGGRIEGAAGAAKLLGLNPSTLRSRMRKLGIDTGVR